MTFVVVEKIVVNVEVIEYLFVVFIEVVFKISGWCRVVLG